MEQFIAEWKNLYDSKSGERGIYNVAAAQAQAGKYGRRDPEIHYGTNPCSEISLAPSSGMTQIVEVMKSREGKKLRPIDVLDIMNILGSIVVAGNVRRSAEIALGDVDDVLFLRAKRWDLETLPAWRSNSNNSIYCNDINKLLPHFWEGYNGNGESYGLLNIDNCRKYGRIGEKKVDKNIEGVNPCFAYDTLMNTSTGDVEIGQWAENGDIREVWIS